MKTTIICSFLISALLFIAACSSERTENKGSDEFLKSNFFLYVSNQSFETKNVDILVKIDNDIVIHGMFGVGDGHNWQEFEFRLAPGKHRIFAFSMLARAELERDFEIIDTHYATLNFWYSQEQDYKYKIPTFTFDISDKPGGFV